MALPSCNSNHSPLSLITKGVLGGTYGLLTKGIISDFIQIEIITKKGKRRGSAALGGKYDKDYWKRFRRDLEEDEDEIDVIIVKIRKENLPKNYQISAELIRPQVEAELLEMQLYDDEDNKPKIDIELLDNKEYEKAKVDIRLIEEEYKKSKPTIKTELIQEDDDNDKTESIDIKLRLIKESFIYNKMR